MQKLLYEIGAPDVCGPLAVFPVLGAECRTDMRSFAEATVLGATVRELERGADVQRLVATNPLEVPVLLYEGEQVEGAQQDRTLDVSVLVGAGASVEVPVTCVERGRWDGARHGERFVAAPQASYPALRRLKNQAARATGVAAAAQGDVWEEVARKSSSVGARGATGAMRDAFAARADVVGSARAAVSRRDGQLGAVCCIGGSVVVLDWVGRADVFAALHGPLVSGYALDAAECAEADPPVPSAIDVAAFVDAALGAPRVARPAVGLGEDVRFAGAVAEGAGLAVDGDLVALTAFPGTPRRAGRVRRPSRRR